MRLQALTLARKCQISQWLPCGADGRTYAHMTTKFLGWTDSQIFLTIELNEAPRTRGASLKMFGSNRVDFCHKLSRIYL